MREKIKTMTEIVSLIAEIRTTGEKIVATSGGFDPLHIGHLRCIQESSHYGRLIVIVNGVNFLIQKKGKPFMIHSERMEIIAGLAGVSYVVGWDDPSATVTGALEIIRPDFFTKGGDRDSSQVVPEARCCEQMGCQVIYGVGGGKIRSSSELIKQASQK